MFATLAWPLNDTGGRFSGSYRPHPGRQKETTLREFWFLHILRATPNQGIADTLEEAKAALVDSYRRHAGHMR